MSNPAPLPPRITRRPCAAVPLLVDALSRLRGGRRTAARAACLALAALAFAAAPLRAQSTADAPPPSDGVGETPEARWDTLRAHYFGEREIASGEGLLALDTPTRAHDAAIVPVAVHALDPDRGIRRVHLIVDENPLPLAGVFTFDEEARGWRTLETRVRVNEYTDVRAVAELEDGALVMVSRFVKAAGGCSAPAMSDMDAALARAGRMRLLIDEASGERGEGASPALASATIKISHPNSSGMQFDQISRNYIPAFFVERIGAELGGRPLIDVETNFSLSENPVVTLTFPARDTGADGAADGGRLDVHALDSKGNRYEGSASLAGDS